MTSVTWWQWFLFRDGVLKMEEKVRHEDVVDDLSVIRLHGDQKRLLFEGDDLIVIDHGEGSGLAFYVRKIDA